MKGAFEVATAGLDVIWQTFLLGMQQAWNEFKDFFVGGWHDAVMLLKVETAEAVNWMERQMREIEGHQKEKNFFRGLMAGIFEPLYTGQQPSEIITEHDKAADEQDEFRKAELDTRKAALKLAREKLKEIEERLRPAPIEAGPMPREVERKKAIEGLSGTVRGQFGGQFGSRGLEGLAYAGGDSIAKQQLDEQKKGNGLLDGIKRKIGGLEVN